MAFTADNQVELGGVLLGPGTDYDIIAFNPWEAPDFRTSEVHRGQLHGVVAGTDMMGAKRVSLSVLVRGADQATALSNLQALQYAWSAQTTDTELYFRLDGKEYLFYGRPRGATVKGTGLWGRNVLSAELRFVATDPFYYDSDTIETDLTEAWGGQSSGLDLSTALTTPLDLGGLAYDGIISIDLTAPGPVPFELWARRWQANVFELRHLEQGRSIVLNPGLNGITNNYWIVDTKTREDRHSSTGSSSGFTTLSGHNWFWLTPGTNTLKLVVDNHPTYDIAQYKIVYRNAYL